MKPLFNHKLILLLVTVLSVASCQRENRRSNREAVQDIAMSDRIFSEIKNIADEASTGKMSIYKSDIITLNNGCATLTLDTVSNPKSIIIDFGPVNCLCNDNRNRRGSITVFFNGRYRDAGTVLTHTFADYFVNDHQITGKKTVENKGLNAQGNAYFEIKEEGSVIKPFNEGTIVWNSNRTREWIEGANTPFNIFDDVYSITGTAFGTTANGTDFTMDITSPLIIRIGCRNITSGVLSIKLGQNSEWTLDYGNGTCNNKAVLTINNRTWEINLP